MGDREIGEEGDSLGVLQGLPEEDSVFPSELDGPEGSKLKHRGRHARGPDRRTRIQEGVQGGVTPIPLQFKIAGSVIVATVVALPFPPALTLSPRWTHAHRLPSRVERRRVGATRRVLTWEGELRRMVNPERSRMVDRRRSTGKLTRVTGPRTKGVR